MIRLYCATGNAGKLREFRLAANHAPVQIEPVPGYKQIPPCEENGATFAENALIKARHYAPYVDGLLFADDSGLVVEALDGAPGIYSARFAGPNANDAANNRLLLEKLRGVPNRAASFVCVIAMVEGGVEKGIYTGRVDGVLLEEARGPGGFGYDPLFYYPPFACTFGEASEEQKFVVSHRGQAFRSLLSQVL
ncbi:Non-canonical purine NTP pyrophosphatase [Candidatus Sulfopaludibacter sp. SbA3]|nr:Non-canonical purine NTP pyrophosphatase [Candidatus Sulfopaludibacter sp. SbA3]